MQLKYCVLDVMVKHPKKTSERYSDRATMCDTCGQGEAYQRIANMSAKSEGKERTDWHQVIAVCKGCRPAFEKRTDFEGWCSPATL